MVRFIRNLLITLIILAGLLYWALWYFAEPIIDRMYPPITVEFIGAFQPGSEDEYHFDVRIKLWPPTVVIKDLYIEADALRVDGDTWQAAHLGIDRIELELLPLLKDEEIVIKSIEGRKFFGRLSNNSLAERLERNSTDLRNLRISEYQEQCRIQGDFGLVTIMPLTLLGNWEVDDRGIATFKNRSYYNPDSVVPEGWIQLVEERNAFDIRVEILEKGLTIDAVTYDQNGLWINALEE